MVDARPNVKAYQRDIPSLLQVIIGLVESSRCPLQDEKQTQALLHQIFLGAGLTVSREHRLSDADIPDFLIDGCIVEVKIKGQRSAMQRQLLRYSQHPGVRALVLASGKSIALPAQINGLPMHVASLSQGWL